METITRDQYLQAMDIVYKYRRQIELDLARINRLDKKNEDPFYKLNPNKLLKDCGISTRCHNVLRWHYSKEEFFKITLKDMSLLKEEELMEMRNMGTKTVQELRSILAQADLHFSVEE